MPARKQLLVLAVCHYPEEPPEGSLVSSEAAFGILRQYVNSHVSWLNPNTLAGNELRRLVEDFLIVRRVTGDDDTSSVPIGAHVLLLRKTEDDWQYFFFEN